MITELPERWCVFNDPNFLEIGEYFENILNRRDGRYTKQNLKTYLSNTFDNGKYIIKDVSGSISNFSPKIGDVILTWDEFQYLVLGGLKPDPIYEIY